jgi:hypothetical protein
LNLKKILEFSKIFFATIHLRDQIQTSGRALSEVASQLLLSSPGGDSFSRALSKRAQPRKHFVAERLQKAVL